MIKNKLYILLQKIVPQHLLSLFAGFIANCHWPWVKNSFIHWFIRRYQVDMSAAIQPDPSQYPTFNSFFTRHLKPELRPIDQDPNSIVSPVDGIISQAGSLQMTRIIQAKGFDYDLLSLLGGNNDRAQPFLNGNFVTLYLAPKDYHRVHMPISGQLKEMTYIPGNLFSVNSITANHIPHLFSRNERVVCIFETPIGQMAMILVGAMIVASINTAWAGKITPPRQQKIQTWSYHDKIMLNRADEMGYFELGSTVILLFEPNRIGGLEKLESQQKIYFGQNLAKVVAS